MPNHAVTSTPPPARRLDPLRMEGAFAVSARVATLRAAGRTVADLSIGEPAFPVPPHVTEAGLRALRDGDTRYSPPAGIPELREAIAADLRRRRVPRTPAEVVVTPGAKTGLLYAFLALVEEGAEVLLPDPGFPAYESLTRLAGGTPIRYGYDENGEPDLEELAVRVTPRTRVLVLNLPGNPIGGASEGALASLGEFAERHRLWVISDEIYARIHFAHAGAAPSIAAVPRLAERTVVVDGFSKAWAMTGWRLGSASFPAALADAAVRLAVNGHSCVPPFVQRAGVAALTGPDHALRATVATLRERRDRLVAELSAIPGVRCTSPGGAFYAYADCREALDGAGLTTDDLALRLLEEQGVAAVPGTAFGARGAGGLRFSFAAEAAAIPAAAPGLAACLRTLAPLAGASR